MYKTRPSIPLFLKVCSLFQARYFPAQILQLLNSNPKPIFQFPTLQFSSSSSNQSWLSVPGKPIINWPHQPFTPPHPETTSSPKPDPILSFSCNEFSTIGDWLRDPSISPRSSVNSVLDQIGIEPGPVMLQAVFAHFDSSPKLLHSLFLWAKRKPGFQPTESFFSSMINVLAKPREFDSTWSLILEHVNKDEEPNLVFGDTL